MSDLVAKGCGIMRTETDGGAVCEWYYANGQERMDWPEDGVKAFLAAVLDDLIQRAPLGRTESPVQFLSRAKREMPLPAAVAPQDAPNADSGTTTPERGQGRTTRDER